MVVENSSESFGKVTVPADSPRAARMRCEVAMSDCVNSVLSRYANSLEKKREVPLQSGSIWDLDPNSQKRVRKNSNSDGTRMNIWEHCAFLMNADNRVRAKEIRYRDEYKNNMQTDSYLDELFPDLCPKRACSPGTEKHHDRVPLGVKDTIPSSVQIQERPRLRSRNKYANSKPSFEEWTRQRFQEVIPQEVSLDHEKDPENPPTPFERNKLDHLENNYFYGVVEDDSNYEDASETDIDDDNESINETEELPKARSLLSVLDYLKRSGLMLSVPSAFYGTIKHPTGSRILKTKRINVGSFKQTLSNRRPFFIKPESFLTLKITPDRKAEPLVLLGLEILEIRNIFPQVFRLIAAVNYQGIMVPYSSSAVEVIFKYAFQLTYRIVDWQVAMEVYKLACVLELPPLKHAVQTYFMHNPIPTMDVMKASALADDLSFREMLENVLVSNDDQPLPVKGLFSFDEKCCILSYSLYTEPSKLSSLDIPYVYHDSTRDLAMIKTTDVRNQLEIEAIRTRKEVAGLELKFVVDKKDSVKKVQIFCEATLGKKQVFELEKEIILKPLVSLMFDEKITVGGEKLKIQVLVEDIKSCYCVYVEKQVIEDKYLKVDLKSNNKNSDKKYLYFISKVLYC